MKEVFVYDEECPPDLIERRDLEGLEPMCG